MARKYKRRTTARKSTYKDEFPLQLAARFAEKLINLAEDEQNRDLPGMREKHMLAVATGEARSDRYGADGLNDKFSKFADDVYTYLKLFAATNTNSPAPLCEVLEEAARSGATRPYEGGTGDRGNAGGLREDVEDILRDAKTRDEAELELLGDLVDNVLGEAIPGVDPEQVGQVRVLLQDILTKKSNSARGTD